MPLQLWALTALCVWLGSLLFAAFGMFIGYLLPTENVMQIMGLIMMLLSFAGGLFIPLSQYPHAFQVLAKFTPLYGLNELVHAPLLAGSVGGWGLVTVLASLGVFVAGAARRVRGDTSRVGAGAQAGPDAEKPDRQTR